MPERTLLPARPFFSERSRSTGLALFLNAGDPADDELVELAIAMDEAGVDCLELAVPFPDSVTDGPVIRASAERALAAGTDLAATLRLVTRIRERTERLRVALLVDWSHSLRGRDLASSLRDVRASGADAVLVHGLPPVLRQEYLAAAGGVGLPVVTTCYHGTSSPETIAAAGRDATAYVYLVARYGRSGTPSDDSFAALAGTVAELRRSTSAPIAVGFGVATADDVRQLAGLGVDAAIVGTAGVRALRSGCDGPVAAFRSFLTGLLPATR
ncbi:MULTISPECIES: tryptophan synthase subunit alpha [unclassified Rathayibacter]|uniref:tryptophan synthase subunit alpha n=1 Tax=unclassified Rathayibacter TaxID=2609250 RepID=UPI00188CE643|nr:MULTISPECIES: tryptophan synthase subunit alpha [unclassified Rathayibacter]MBF4463175.1 tryptophan synthase subunit alpha [Rathayibacter sp. VKM Ac-2879]MBF4504588.1 tryptophan synthase subunit alpha [Rathayibacter sp. VKM Ac-2878]